MTWAVYSAQARRMAFFDRDESGTIMSASGEALGNIDRDQLPRLFSGYSDTVQVDNVDEGLAKGHFESALRVDSAVRFLFAILDPENPPASRSRAMALLEEDLNDPRVSQDILQAISSIDTSALEGIDTRFPPNVSMKVATILRALQRRMSSASRPQETAAQPQQSLGGLTPQREHSAAARRAHNGYSGRSADYSSAATALAAEYELQFEPRQALQFNFTAGKRILDLAVASAMLVLTSPIMLGVALAIRVTDGGPALYHSIRVGIGGRPISVLKFRTMVMNSEQVLQEYLIANTSAMNEWQQTLKLRNDPRITKLGQFLRTTGFDELPQLFNVLRGDMSMIGPRPVSSYELARYEHHVTTYLSLRPGILDVTDAFFPDDVTYESRVAATVRYADSVSVWTDVKHLFHLLGRKFR